MSQRMYLYSTKLHFVVSKGDTNFADLNALGFSFQKLKLLEAKLTTQNLSPTSTNGFAKCNVDRFSINKCIT